MTAQSIIVCTGMNASVAGTIRNRGGGKASTIHPIVPRDTVKTITTAKRPPKTHEPKPACCLQPISNIYHVFVTADNGLDIFSFPPDIDSLELEDVLEGVSGLRPLT